MQKSQKGAKAPAKNSTKNKPNSNRKPSAQQEARQSRMEQRQKAERRNREIAGLIFIALGIFVLMTFTNMTGYVGEQLSSFFYGLFGILLYAMPIILIVYGIYIIIFASRDFHAVKGLLVMGIVFCLLSVVHVYAIGTSAMATTKPSYLNFIMNSFLIGETTHIGGGLFGALLSYLPYYMIGKAGSYLLFGTGIVIMSLVLTELSLRQTGEKVSQFFLMCKEKWNERTSESRVLRETEREERKLERQQEREEKRKERQLEKLELREKQKREQQRQERLRMSIAEMENETVDFNELTLDGDAETNRRVRRTSFAEDDLPTYDLCDQAMQQEDTEDETVETKDGQKRNRQNETAQSLELEVDAGMFGFGMEAVNTYVKKAERHSAQAPNPRAAARSADGDDLRSRQQKNEPGLWPDSGHLSRKNIHRSDELNMPIGLDRENQNHEKNKKEKNPISQEYLPKDLFVDYEKKQAEPPGQYEQEPYQDDGEFESGEEAVIYQDCGAYEPYLPPIPYRRYVEQNEIEEEELYNENDGDAADMEEEDWVRDDGLLLEEPDFTSRRSREDKGFVAPAVHEQPITYESPDSQRLTAHVAESKKTSEASYQNQPARSPAEKLSEKTSEKPMNPPAEKTDAYIPPPIDLLNRPSAITGAKEDIREKSQRLETTLQDFGIKATVVNATQGPVITRFELQPSPGVRVNRITNLSDDIALALAAPSVRIEAPIPGKSAVGIEIPNLVTTAVSFRELLESPTFQQHPSKIAVALGRDISGNVMVADIAKMPHLLIAGSTGSGKSVCINTIICSFIYHASPEEVKLIMVDPKVVELASFAKIPHLLIPVVTNPEHAAKSLQWAVKEMTRRYNDFASKGARDLARYNELLQREGLKKEPQIVIIVDELADLMMTAPSDVEEAICRIAQMGRAAGIHLIIATQRPSADIITGLIKANVPSRIAFAVASATDSRIILDAAGADKLLGRGDMLFNPIGASQPTRVQGALVTDEEIERLRDYFEEVGLEAEFDEQASEEIKHHVSEGKTGDASEENGDFDPLLPEIVEMFMSQGQASVSMIQRRMRVGYAKAGRLIDELENMGIVSPSEGSKPRKVLISRAEFEQVFGYVPTIPDIGTT